MIIESNKPKVIAIGKWVDEMMAKYSQIVQHNGPENANMDLIDITKIDKTAYIASTDNYGNMNWHHITNLTRHDPSELLYKIRTKWGREVTVVESDSLLVWNANKKTFETKQSNDVELGDKVGITFNLKPFNEISNVDMKDYLDCKEYIYGSQYNNQGLKTKKWSVMDGYVYGKCSRNNSSSLREKFELNRKNGFFIGIYLAEGNAHKDYVGIANNDPELLDLVKEWFMSNNINCKTQVKKLNPIRPGISMQLRGYSSILVQFLDKFVGKYSHGKYVPFEAYNAPDEFVKGLIDGYISGDGCVTEYHVKVSSVSKDLITGINSLLSRFGIFAKISRVQQKSNNIGSKNILPAYVLSIQSKYVYRFREVFTLSHNAKQKKLTFIASKKTLSNMSYLYEEQNDVILDPIIEIQKIESGGQKVYDLTVPNTLNFQIYNGLNVHDTSETGYLQRKLVKAMEDCKINYDFTVRNASGSIIQFLYGEDGMDAAKIESQPIIYIEKDFDKLKEEYLWTAYDKVEYFMNPDAIKAFHATAGWEATFKSHFDIIMKDREYIITKIFENKKETSLLYPISLMRLINNSKAIFKDKGLSDLNPIDILNTINTIGEELYVSKINPGNMILQMLLRCYLSPKKVIFDYKFSKSTFDYIIQQIKLKFYDAIAHPSEMVGVIAAQSIGEPATQMSTIGKTMIRVVSENFNYNGPIGKLIDNFIDQNKEKVQKIGRDSVVMDLVGDYHIIGVSNDEKTSWKRISQISRHPANGGLVKITTASGKSTTATLSHSFLKRTESGIEPVLGSDLKLGQRIPVAKNVPIFENCLLFKQIGELGEVALSRDFGWLCGAYIADGSIGGNTISISKIIPEYCDKITEVAKTMFEIDTNSREKTETKKFRTGKEATYTSRVTFFNSPDLAEFLTKSFGNGSHVKHLPAWVYSSNTEFIAGLLGGYFDGDGSVNANEGKQMIRNGSVSEALINDIIVLLSYMGVFASKCVENPKVIDGLFHTIQISKKYARTFKEKIGFVVKDKAANLESLIEYVEETARANTREEIDKIPELGNIIAFIGKKLKLPAQSRTYGRWTKKDSIGRSTLINYIDIFEYENNIQKNNEVAEKIKILRQAAFSDIIWDEIVELEHLDDPKEYVYDFTVPGNDSFMVDTGILVHNTLNTFHLSGVSSASKAVRGVPRIKELLSVTRNIKTPALTIYLKDPYNKDKMKAKEVLNTIQTTYFADIVKSTKIYYDPDDFNTTIEDDKEFLETYKEFIDQEMVEINNISPWLLRLEFNKDKMLEYDINMMEIYNAIQDFYEDNVAVMFSDDNANKLVFRIKIHETEDKHDDIITDLKALEKNILENLIVKGVKKVSRVVMNKNEFFEYNPDTLTFEKAAEWVLETSGTNLIDILAHRNVDAVKTISNDINEIYETLGIDAARQALFNEISDVIKFADLYVNYRHLALLVDTMTNKGYMLSIDRHGINRVDIGPLAKSSFEETNDMIIKAGIFSELDKINGVSANIMLGQVPPCGTGDTDILIDEEKLMALIVEASQLMEPLNPDEVCQNISVDYTIPSNGAKTRRSKPKQSLKIV